ncbi:hypothetical protein [Tabrizicola sp.]|uniref:hypothetical protein n=1 Tax=Tabrizicola sp. TaxID=2005166 RepID=UPI003F30CFBC
MPQTEFSPIFSQCTKADVHAWRRMKATVGEMMNEYPSLRGSLAHALFYLMSNTKKKVGIATVAKSYVDFQDYLVENFGSEVSQLSDTQSISHFMQRETEKFKDGGNYLNVVLFLLGIASSQKGFFSHYVIKSECQEVSLLVSRMLEVTSKSEFSLNDLAHAVEEYRNHFRGKYKVQHDLGGMLELGSFDQESLWQTIFHVSSAKVDYQRGKRSIERKYICYRYSSSGGISRIVKSFLVLQSPGSIRSHFAFKAFYIPDSDQMIRRSAGAIVRLGETISCYGSSRLLHLEHEASPVAIGEEYHSGPKVMVFDLNSFKSNDTIIPGTLLSMNENIQPIASRIVCVETSIERSDLASIGTFNVEELSGDLQKFTCLGTGGRRSPEQIERTWQRILEILEAAPGQGVVVGLQKQDVGLRLRE